MKKLIATMAAIVTGFAAWALPSWTSFEGSAEFSDGALVVDGTTWSTNGAPTLTQGTYGTSEVYPYGGDKGNRYEEFGNTQANYLDVKTTFGQPLERLVNVTVEADTPVYFDQLVKFTATDEAPNLDLYTNEKLVIYALDKSELETGATPSTNLMVVAGRYASGELSSATYDFGEIDIDEWHRLTIKAIKAYNNTALGFEIFLDGVALAYSGSNKAYDSTAVANLTTGATALNQAQKIVASLDDTASTVDAVGFDGQGAIDDVMATETPPGEWAKDKNVMLKWDHTTLDGLTYTAHGQTTELVGDDLSADSAAIPYMSGMEITVNPTFKQNWGFDEFAGSGFSVNGMTLTITADNAEPTIVAKDVTPRIEYVVGDTTNYYPTFAAALTNVSSGTLKLKMPVSVGLNAGGGTEGTIESDKNITIDLAGQTITGTATVPEGYVNVLGGSLTIMDSSGNDSGSVVMGAGTSYAGVVSVGSIINENHEEEIGTLAISGGTFGGAVVVDPGYDDEDPEESYPAGEASLTGGKYQYSSNKTSSDEFTLADYVADGYTAAKDDDETPGYWVINALPKATVTLTYDSAKVTVTGVANGDQVAVGSTITVTATPKTGYENAVVTINGTPQSTYTVDNADVEGGVMIEVAVTAIKWTITYLDPYEEVLDDTQTYTIESRGSATLKTLSYPNYADCSTWFKLVDEGEHTVDVTSLADQTGDLTLYGNWNESGGTGHTVTITWSDVAITQVTYQVNSAAAVEATRGEVIPVDDGATFTIAALTSSDWTKVSGLVTALPISTDTNIVLSTAQFDPDTDFDGKSADAIAQETGINTSSALVAAGANTVRKAIKWAEVKGVSTATVNAMDFTAGAENRAAKAFLFGVADTDEAVAEAEAAFAFTSITPGELPPIDDSGYNGTVTIKGCDTVNGTYVAPATASHHFYKAELALPAASQSGN